MKSTRKAEAHVLDRVMYLLEERSVTNLMQADTNFATYIDELYKAINVKTEHLRNGVVA